mgnify:CR=1 FL=1|jgi:serine/threonine protein phosphatase PrpC
MPLQLDRDFAGRQTLGTRDEQQDAYAFSIVEGDESGAEKLLVIVADGMGGHLGGREASLAAVNGFVDAFFDAIDAPEDTPESGIGETSDVPSQILNEEPALNSQNPPPIPTVASSPDSASLCADPAASGPEGASSHSLGQTSAPPQDLEENAAHTVRAASDLKTALLAANASVDKMIEADPDTLGEAGTTLVAALVQRDSVRWISVGDSPLLLWRQGKLSRLNADHSMRAVFAEKVAAKQMRPADVKTHPERNALLAVLNGLEIPKIDEPAEAFALQPGDLVVVASDGILTLTGKEISETLKKLQSKPVLEIVRSLLEKVDKKNNPKQDNTTLAIVRV